jgi:DNA-binding FadR family transcriptional regulator
MDFHVELACAAKNEVREATVQAYRELLVPSIYDLHDERSDRATQKAHEELVEAVRRHDPEGAVRRGAVAARARGHVAT